MHIPFETPAPSEFSGKAPAARGAVALGILCVLCGTMIIVFTGADQLTAAIVQGAMIVVLALFAPQAAIIATMIYLAFLGDVRRYIIVASGVVGKDPLLLVGPVAALTVLAVGLLRRGLRLGSNLSRLILALMLIMLLQIFNPLQGGIETGIAGALFYMVPLIWFWIGQCWSSPAFLEKILYRVVIPIAVLAAILGLTQTFYGFFRFEAEAMRITNSAIVAVSRNPRPFAFFVSPAEYANYVTVGLAIALTPLAMRRPRLSLIVAPLLAIAVIAFGAKGPIVELLFAAVVLWAVQARRAGAIVARAMFAAVVGMAGLVYIATQAQTIDFGEAVQPYIERETQGFTNVQSTDASVHGQMFLTGVWKGITNPLGYGLGASTFVSQAGIGSSEVDISNMFISLGIVGGLLYIAVIVTTVRLASRYWQGARSVAALATLALLAVQVTQWLTGSHYALSALCWFVIGSLDAAASVSLPHSAAQPIAVTRRRAVSSFQPQAIA